MQFAVHARGQVVLEGALDVAYHAEMDARPKRKLKRTF